MERAGWLAGWRGCRRAQRPSSAAARVRRPHLLHAGLPIRDRAMRDLRPSVLRRSGPAAPRQLPRAPDGRAGLGPTCTQNGRGDTTAQGPHKLEGSPHQEYDLRAPAVRRCCTDWRTKNIPLSIFPVPTFRCTASSRACLLTQINPRSLRTAKEPDTTLIKRLCMTIIQMRIRQNPSPMRIISQQIPAAYWS